MWEKKVLRELSNVLIQDGMSPQEILWYLRDLEKLEELADTAKEGKVN